MRTRSPRRSSAPDEPAPHVASAPLGSGPVEAHRMRLDGDVDVAIRRVGGHHDTAAVEHDLVAPRRAAQQVDADQVGDVARARRVRHLPYGARLRDAPVLQHDESVGERHRVEEVVGHEHTRTSERREVSTHVTAQFGARPDVEGGQRLVEQQEARFGDHRSGERDALLLPAGERPRLRAGAVPPGRREPTTRRRGDGPRRGGRRGCAPRTPRSRAPTGAGTGGSPGTRRRSSGVPARRTSRRTARRRPRRRARSPAREWDETGERAQERGLPRAIGPQHGDGLAIGRREGDIEVERAPARRRRQR